MQGSLKTTLALSITSLILTGCAGTPINQEDLSYTVTIPATGKSKDELYVNANTWLVSTFNNADSVVQFSDKEAGKIAGKFYAAETVGATFYGVRQTITIDVKDEKTRLTFTDPQSKFEGSVFGSRGPQPGHAWSTIYDHDLVPVIRNRWQRMEASYRAQIGKTDNW